MNSARLCHANCIYDLFFHSLKSLIPVSWGTGGSSNLVPKSSVEFRSIVRVLCCERSETQNRLVAKTHAATENASTAISIDEERLPRLMGKKERNERRYSGEEPRDILQSSISGSHLCGKFSEVPCPDAPLLE